jgi:hypothetical protein
VSIRSCEGCVSPPLTVESQSIISAADPLRQPCQECDIIGRSHWQPVDYAYLALCLLLTLFAVAPLTYPGYLQVHSGFLPYYHLTDLNSHAFSLQWTPNLLTPFDPLRGDGLLPYYLAAGFVSIGLPPLAALRTVFGLSVLLGAVGMYTWLRHWWGPAAGLVGALVYTYLPYHLGAYLVRGSLGEALLLGLLPLAVYLVLSPKRPGLLAALLTAFVWLLLGFSQLGLALMAMLAALLWRLLSHGFRRSTLSWTQPAAIIGLAASATLTLSLTNWQAAYSYVNFSDHFLFVSQLFSPYWGFDASRAGWNDGLSLGYGLGAAGLVILAIFLALSRRGRYLTEQEYTADRPAIGMGAALGMVALLSLFLFQPSQPLWHLLRLDQLIIFPWQMLALIGLGLAVAAASTLRLEPRLTTPPLLAGAVLFVMLSSYAYLQPRFTQLTPPREPVVWDSGHVLLLDLQVEAKIPQSSAGLTQPTPGRLPLADYGLPQPGDTLLLDFTWQAVRPIEQDLNLFVHLLDTSGDLAAQTDPPAGAAIDAEGQSTNYATSMWQPGELVSAQVSLPIPVTANPGPYHLAFGLYDPETLERLPLPGHPEDRFVLELSRFSSGRGFEEMGR